MLSKDAAFRPACHGLATDLFFDDDEDAVELAKAVCAGCTVRLPCLLVAFSFNEQHGVFGGLTDRERRSMIRRAGGRAPLIRALRRGEGPEAVELEATG